MEPQVPPGFVRAELGAGFGQQLGPVYVDRARGRIGFRVEARHLNPVATCHGGALTTFCDLQLMALRGGREEGLPHSPTVSLSVDFLGPAKAGAWVEAEVQLLRETQTLLFIHGLVTADGELVARSNAIYRRYNP